MAGVKGPAESSTEALTKVDEAKEENGPLALKSDPENGTSAEASGHPKEKAAVNGTEDKAVAIEETDLGGVELSEELRKSIRVLTCDTSAEGGKGYVYILGVAHVSQVSARQVRELIQAVVPQIVFVELCGERRFFLSPQANQKTPSFMEVLKMVRQKPDQSLGILYGWLISSVSEKLGVQPGDEFRVAKEEAKACGAIVQLGDRPVQITLKRTWAKLSLWQRVKLAFCFMLQTLNLPSKEDLRQMIEELQSMDLLADAVKELGASFPTLRQTMVTERDMYMTFGLRHFARRVNRVVAVVGRGHMNGIAEFWDKDIDIHELMQVEPVKGEARAWSWSSWTVVGIVAGSTVLVFALRSKFR